MGAGLSFIGSDFIIGTWYRVVLRVLLCVEGITRVLFIFSDSSLLALWYQTDFEIFKFLKIIGTLSFEGVLLI